MKIVDLSHVMNVHTPGWVGYAGNKMYYAQNLPTQMIVAQRIDTALGVGHSVSTARCMQPTTAKVTWLPCRWTISSTEVWWWGSQNTCTTGR